MDIEMELRPDYLYVRMSGKYEDAVPVESHPDAMERACREGDYRRLLVDIRELTGQLDTLVSYHRGKEIAEAFSLSSIHIAMVSTKEHIGVLSFFENVIVNRGTILKVFTDMDEAQEWLMKRLDRN